MDINREREKVPASSFPFKGSFDGQGYRIYNLKQEITGKPGDFIYAGLFGYIENSTIQNLGITIADDGITTGISGTYAGSDGYVYSGGIVGYAKTSTIQNCFTTNGDIIIDCQVPFFNQYTGGIVGYINSGAIKHCYSTVNIQNAGKLTYCNHMYLGGIVGHAQIISDLEISNSFYSGKINMIFETSGGNHRLSPGGIIGEASPYSKDKTHSINNCIMLGTIYLENKNTSEDLNMSVQRIIGKINTDSYTPMTTTISNCHAQKGNRFIVISKKGDKQTLSFDNDMASVDGADWEPNDLPADIFNNKNWQVGNLPIMPKLKTTTGNLMNDQPDVYITYPILFDIKDIDYVMTENKDFTAYEGEKVTIVAATGYRLTNVFYIPDGEGKKTATPTDGKYTFTMPKKEVNIEATYKREYQINTTPNESTINITNGENAIEGENVNFTVSANEGYLVKGVTVEQTDNQTPISTISGSDQYSFTMPAADVTITVTTEKVYTINTVANHSEINIVGDKKVAAKDEKVEFTVSANEGYLVKGVTVEQTDNHTPISTISGSDQYSFTMPAADVTITVATEKKSYNITTTIDSNSEIIIEGNKSVAVMDEEVKFTPSAKDGYQPKEVKVEKTDGQTVATTSANGQYSFTMPADNVTITVTSEIIPQPKPEPNPDPSPTIYHTATLPSVEGATTDPVAGNYDVESWGSFHFYLTLNDDYNESQPIVTTSLGETITPRSSDGAYLIKFIRSDVEIFIDGIAKNPDPVANETIEVDRPKAWCTNNYLHLQSPTDQKACIYTANGYQQALYQLAAGEVKTIQLPTGIYFVRIGKEQFKIVM